MPTNGEDVSAVRASSLCQVSRSWSCSFRIFTAVTPKELGTVVLFSLNQKQAGVHCGRSGCLPRTLERQGGLGPGLVPPRAEFLADTCRFCCSASCPWFFFGKRSLSQPPAHLAGPKPLGEVVAVSQ